MPYKQVMGTSKKNAGFNWFSGIVRDLNCTRIKKTALTASREVPTTSTSSDAKAAIEAIPRLLASEARPVPLKATRPNTKTSSSQTKLNPVASKGRPIQLLSTRDSSVKIVSQSNPKMIN